MPSIPTLTVADDASSQPLTTRLSGWRRAIQVVAWGLVAVWSLLLLAWLTLHWGILSHIERWRPEIEARAGAALGAVVHIGHIEVKSGSWIPALDLRDVVVLDAQRREAVRLPHVFAALSARSLLARELRLSQLLIDGAQLDVRRDVQGRYFVGGLALGGAGDDDGRGADWFFRQYEIAVRGGTLRWTDERRGTPTLALDQVDLVVRNTLRRHDLRFDATPPPDWGSRFSFQARLTQPILARPGDWRQWSGTVQADLPQSDVRRLGTYVALPFELNEGEGALRAWLELRSGEPRELTLDVALRSVALRLAADVEPLAFAEVEGRVVASRSNDGVVVQAQQVGFITGDGLRWPRGNARLAWKQRQDAVGATTVMAPVSGGEFSADRLDLGLMAAIASRVPLGDALRKLLAEAAPQGIVSGLGASWDGPLDAPAHYRVKSRFDGLSLAARPAAQGVGRPGLRNVGIDLEANERGGTAALSLADGAIDLPGVFEEPVVPLQRLSAQVRWSIGTPPAPGRPPPLEVQVRQASFANSDAQSQLDATWRTGEANRLPGVLVLDGTLSKGLADRTARYLPLGLPQSVRDYVEHAISGGALTLASYHVKGDLAQFPFVGSNRGEGEFRIAGHAEDLDFAYVPAAPGAKPEWPPFSKVSADLVFDRASMEIRNGRARVNGVVLSDIQAGIRNLAEHAVLTVDGNAQGPMADLLRYVAESPVAGFTSGGLTPITATGPGQLKLSLGIPLDALDKTTVKGSVTLAGNDVRVRPEAPLLAGARGQVNFTQQGWQIVGASAQVLGGPATFDGGSQPDGRLRFNGQGTLSADGLRTAAELGAVSRVATSMTGQAAYRMTLGFVGGRPEFDLSSNLVGMQLDLPAPFGKRAEASLPLHVLGGLVPESLAAGQVPRDTLRLDLGNVLQVQYERDLSQAEAKPLRGGIGIGEPAPWPAHGVQANVRVGDLDVDAWQATVQRWFGMVPGGASESGASSAGYVPQTIGLRADALTAGARKVTKLVAGLSQDDGIWRANIDAEQMNGYVEYRTPRRSAAGGGLVYARLSRLVLPKSEDEGVDSLLDEQPSTIPALDIVVDSFELRGRQLGRLVVDAVNHGASENAREWRLNRISLTMPEGQLSGSGNWVALGKEAGARRRAAMDFTLDTSDAGELLDRFGLGKTLQGGKGKLSGQVSWLGSPLSLDYASLSGGFNLTMASGRFLKADAGAARLLGVLSLQALPRRLMLDFRDVFEEGFPFDSVDGDVKIVQGVASTNNLRMRGLQAAVLMDGQADLARETQDLRVVVVPEINAGTASIAYAVINPAIGLGTFLAQLFLRKPMMQAATREFHITGSWTDPKVDRVERKLNDPIPEFDAASAPSPTASSPSSTSPPP